MKPARRQPPPACEGVPARDVWLPDGPWTRLADFLAERYPAIPIAQWRDRMARGRVLDHAGRPLSPDTAYRAQTRIWYYREVPDEAPIAGRIAILHRDDRLLVVDKPHGLPVVPSGRYVTQTVLVRLRQELGLDYLAPLHRLDRDTAGVLMLSLDPLSAGCYQRLFAERAVDKRYLGRSSRRVSAPLPLYCSLRLEPDPLAFPRMRAVPGPANAETWVERCEDTPTGYVHVLRPVTGRKHQLRVQMMMLGAALHGDVLYGEAADRLGLVASSLAFRDPLTGERRRFCSLQRP